MLRKIELFLERVLNEAGSQRLEPHNIEIATAVLLAHCAKADGSQTPEETASLRSILAKRFNLSADEIESVIEMAQEHEREATDLHRFTRVLHQALDRDARIHMIQLLWEIADADGTIDHDERRMVSLTARLLDVEVHDAVAARLAAQARARA